MHINQPQRLFISMILQVLGAKVGFVPSIKFLLEGLYCLSAPRKYPSVIFCSQD